METNEKRILIDVAEFEAEARRIAKVVGIKDDEVRFSLNDMIRNVKNLVDPVNDWRVGAPKEDGLYFVTELDIFGKAYTSTERYSVADGWINDYSGLVLIQPNVIAWQPLPDTYDYKICRHCKHFDRNFLRGDMCGLTGEQKEEGQKCEKWDKKTENGSL